MENDYTTESEGVIVVSGKFGAVAMIRRDPESKKHLVYKVEEMGSEDIAKLIQPGFVMKKFEAGEEK